MAHNYPERSVENNILTSSALPRLHIQVDSSLAYIGNLKSIIYDTAHIDNYYFVERDDEGFITRLLYLQFEGYLPDVDKDYEYPNMTRCQLGNEDFLYDGGVRRFHQSLIDQRGADSDIAQTVDFLAQHGACFAEGDTYAHLRFVQVVSDTKRDKALVLYLERVNNVSDDLAEKSRASDEWSQYCQSLYQQAITLFSIHSNEK